MASRRERREERQRIKREADLEKAARTFDLSPSKSPQHVPLTTEKRIPEIPIPDRRMKYHEAGADRSGRWSWGVRRDWSAETWTGTMLPFLSAYEQKTWNEIRMESTGHGAKRRKKHTSISVSQIKTEARRRLEELGLIDVERLFRFRLSGRFRIWGRKVEHHFLLLWHDPQHDIWGGE